MRGKLIQIGHFDRENDPIPGAVFPEVYKLLRTIAAKKWGCKSMGARTYLPTCRKPLVSQLHKTGKEENNKCVCRAGAECGTFAIARQRGEALTEAVSDPILRTARCIVGSWTLKPMDRND